MLTSGSTKARDLWLDVLEGRCHPLRHGYYCTHQPDDAERTEGISSCEARHREVEFFAKTKPWAASIYKERFGTANLVKTLSALLVTIINDTYVFSCWFCDPLFPSKPHTSSLPKIQSETSSLLSLCTNQLSSIPPALTGETSTQMSILITKFCASIEGYAQGSPEAGRLIHENRTVWRVFKAEIRGTALNFKPFVNATGSSGEFKNWLGDGEDEELISDGQSFYLTDMRRHLEQWVIHE